METKTELINPIELISKMIERNGYGKNLVLGHVNYNQLINSDFDFEIIRSTTHDGTLVFTMNILEEVLLPIINKNAVHADYRNKPLKDINYEIGDIKLVSTFQNNKKHDTASLPIKCQYIYE